MKCSMEACPRAEHSRGWCSTHYKRWLKHGDPSRGARRVGRSTCTVDGCAKQVANHGLCSMHRHRKERHGDPNLVLASNGLPRGQYKMCRVPGCALKSASVLGYCKRHLDRVQKTGEPGPVERLTRRPGEGTIDRGYRYITVDGEQWPEHRVVMERMLGRRLSPHESVHHKNGVRSDNAPSNLELWSKSQPWGQRVEDKVAWCVEMLRLWAPHLLAENVARSA